MKAETSFPVLLAAALFILAPCGESDAQSYQESSYHSPYLEAIPFDPPKPAVPNLSLRLLHDIPLPGPLPGSGAVLEGAEIEIDVAGGRMATGWSADSVPRPIDPPTDAPGPAENWSIAPDGLFRCTVLPSGRILGQKRCFKCRKDWRKKWKLRVAGRGLPPPLVTENRVYYGAYDNRVYSVKRKNGHRVWESDIPNRVSRPLERWLNRIDDDGAELELILLIPDDRKTIIALDAETGTRVATFELSPDGGLLVGAPLVTDDGKIVVASQKYSAEEASLLVLGFAAPAGKAPAVSEPRSESAPH
jgi:hypothetical protein